MPKRSERELFGDAFEDNPFEGLDPEAMYGELQWDKDPEAVWEVDAPEPIVAIGDLAGFEWDDGELELYQEESAPFLAVGRDSNVLYVVPKDEDGAPLERIPKFSPRSRDWQRIGPVVQTDYYSSKGNEAAYYYHEHESPHPIVWEHVSGVRVLVPSRHKGRRSYAVAKEGIVG